MLISCIPAFSVNLECLLYFWPMFLISLYCIIEGSITGLMAALCGNLLVAELVFEDGLSNFFETTSSDYSLMSGCISAIVVSVSITVTVSLLTTKVKSKEDITREWEKTISIDNPLNPWTHLYAEELTKYPESTHVDVHLMTKVFKPARYIAFLGGFVCISLFIIVLPAVVLSFDVLSYDEFTRWLQFSFIICMVGAVFVIVVPPAEEILQIYRAFKLRHNDSTLQRKMDIESEHIQLNTQLISDQN